MFLNKINKVKDILINIFDKNSEVVFISESSDWIVKRICDQVTNALNKKKYIKSRTSSISIGLKNKIIHFNSVNTLFGKNGFIKIDKSNKIVLTWFHVALDDERVKYVKELNDRVNVVQTSCEKTKKDLMKYGLNEDKIVIIPIGINLEIFKNLNEEERKNIKNKINLPSDKIIIGSFQKDGNGWGEGLEPKLIKGPDVFCDVVEKLAKKYPIHILLTGPARGYVKKRLEKAGITYTHEYLKDYLDIASYFNCLDLYLIASRVEGGPRAIAESWATGVPLVTTKVGMACDIVKNKKNAILVDVDDINGLLEGCVKIIEDNKFKDEIITNGLEDVKNLDWTFLAEKYFNLVYKKI